MNQATAQSLFFYENGVLYWKHNKKIAGTKHKSGYIDISVNKKKYKAHRIIFLLLNGYIPIFIDHINCIKHDNRIENLREASGSQNQYNTLKRKTNTSGYKNVYWEKSRNKWRVEIRIGNSKYKVVGRFNDLNDAVDAATKARENYHGNFARHT